MTRSELIQVNAECLPQLNKTDCDVAVSEILDSIRAALSRGDRIEIRGFGSFSLNYRPREQGAIRSQENRYKYLENTHFILSLVSS